MTATVQPSRAPRRPVFGEQRLLPTTRTPERVLFRTIGLADPAHYLHSRLLRRALDRWSDLRPATILDAGCGRGDYAFYLARRYPDALVVAVDLDRALVERNRETARRLGIDNVRFETADLVTVAFAERFDLIVSIDVLEHITEQARALENLRRHLAPGGRVFFHVPTVRERPVPFSGQLAGFHEWAEGEHLAEDRTADEFIAVMREAGYDVRDARRTFGYFTGELATSLFMLPWRNTLPNRVLQACLAPVCRVLALADFLDLERTRYAVAVSATSR